MLLFIKNAKIHTISGGKKSISSKFHMSVSYRSAIKKKLKQSSRMQEHNKLFQWFSHKTKQHPSIVYKTFIPKWWSNPFYPFTEQAKIILYIWISDGSQAYHAHALSLAAHGEMVKTTAIVYGIRDNAQTYRGGCISCPASSKSIQFWYFGWCSIQ